MIMNEGQHVILCVDDDPDFLDSLRIIIESSHYAVVTASSAGEALMRYTECRPDLVMVDLMMEEVDSGVSFVKEIRALGPTPPVYMLSSVGDGLTLSTDYSALGLAGVLQKPINPQALLATLRTKLGR
jgi:DNA-binding response OmpR family regulator